MDTLIPVVAGAAISALTAMGVLFLTLRAEKHRRWDDVRRIAYASMLSAASVAHHSYDANLLWTREMLAAGDNPRLTEAWNARDAALHRMQAALGEINLLGPLHVAEQAVSLMTATLDLVEAAGTDGVGAAESNLQETDLAFQAACRRALGIRR